MTVEIVEVNNCKRNLAVELPSEALDQEVNKIAKEYAGKANIPGFRPGKIPMNIIKQRYRNDLLKEATQKIIERCWKDAVEEHNLRPLAPPSLQDVENKLGSPLKFTLSFEILPELEVKDYKGVPVTLPPIAVKDSNVDQAIEDLREKNAQFVPVDGGEALDGHYLTLTVDGEIEGESKPMHEDDVTLIVGHSQTHEEFSENLRGARSGDTRTFDISYPEDYQRKLFAGKKIHYSVQIKDIKEKQLAELNDEFAKDLGSESLDALRAKVRDDLVTQDRQNAEKKAREGLLDTIVQRHAIDVPECLIQNELEAHTRRLANNLAYQGIDVNQASIDWKKVFEEERPRAEKSVLRSMFLDAIVRQEDISITEEELESELEKLAEGINKSSAALRAQLEKEEQLEGFKQHLRQNKALDFIYRNANISEG